MNRIYELENYIDHIRTEIHYQLDEIYKELIKISNIIETNECMSDEEYGHINDLISIIYARLSKLENL